MEGRKHTSIQKEYDKKEVDDDDDGSDDDEAAVGYNAPYLLSNLAVLEMLQPRVQQRQRMTSMASGIINDTSTHSVTLANNNITSAAFASATFNQQTLKIKRRHNAINRNNKLLRHRNWIENEVVEYIQQTSTMEFHSTTNTIPLQSMLLRRKRRIHSSAQQVPVSTDISQTSTKLENINATLTTLSEETRTLQIGYHLTEAEAIQILNHSPKEMVELHLLIDQIHDRFTAAEQDELLRLIQQYRTLQQPTSPLQTITAAQPNDATKAVLQNSHQQKLYPEQSSDHSNNHDISYHDRNANQMICNGNTGTGSSVRYTTTNSRNHTSFPQEQRPSEEYDSNHNDARTAATMEASSTNTEFVTQVKIEMDINDRKPAAI